MQVAPRRALAALVASVVLLALAPAAGAATRPDLRVTADIEYRPVDGAAPLRLDVWQRPGRTNRPVVVMFHGGGWQSGSRSEWADHDWAQSFAAAGFVVVTPAYRLSCLAKAADDGAAASTLRDAPCGGTMAQQRADVEAAVRWTFANAGRFGGDPRRVVLLGGSAGAHLALMAATDPAIARRIDGIAAISAPVDLRSVGKLGLWLNGAAAQSIGCSWQACPARWADHSPRVAYARAPRVVPTYLYASRRDVRTSRTDAFRFASDLQGRGAQVVLREPASTVSACHGPWSCDRYRVAGTRTTLLRDVLRWSARVSAPPRAARPARLASAG